MRFSASCCVLCSSELEGIVNYREKLLKNQNVLEDLYNSSDDTPGDGIEVKTENEIVFADLLELNASDDFICLELMEDVEDEMFTVDLTADVAEMINDGDSMSGAENPTKNNAEAEKVRHETKVLTTETNKIRKRSSRSGRGQYKKLDQPLKCPECNKEFFNKVYLTRHIFNVHEDQKKMCQTCGAILSNTRGLKNHMFIHQERNYQCDVCSKLFHTGSALQRHKIVS